MTNENMIVIKDVEYSGETWSSARIPGPDTYKGWRELAPEIAADPNFKYTEVFDRLFGPPPFDPDDCNNWMLWQFDHERKRMAKTLRVKPSGVYSCTNEDALNGFAEWKPTPADRIGDSADLLSALAAAHA
jgi:hypothetical protein